MIKLVRGLIIPIVKVRLVLIVPVLFLLRHARPSSSLCHDDLVHAEYSGHGVSGKSDTLHFSGEQIVHSASLSQVTHLSSLQTINSGNKGI